MSSFGLSKSGMTYVVECFWVGVTEEDLLGLDDRTTECVAGMTRQGDGLRYLGSILLRSDEVVLSLFEGSVASVQAVAKCAQIPYERILETAVSLTSLAASPTLREGES